MKPAKLTLSLTAALLLTACATTDQGQRVVGEKATNMASTAAMLESESGRAEERIGRAGVRVHDAKLEAYVQDLADKSAGQYGGELRTYVLEAPVFNAFMMPNGAMGVNTGLLLRAETEDELVLVLGHEFGHYYEKHSLERHAQASNTTTALKFMSIAAGAAAVGTGTYVDTSLVSTAMVAGFYSFNRSQESEADEIGIKRAEQMGYDVTTAIRLWENLEGEKKASSLRAIRNRHSSIYDTHPTNKARIEALKESVGLTGPTTRAPLQERSDYRKNIRPFLKDWLDDEVALRDAGATLNLLDRLDELGEDTGVLLYARARVIDYALSNKKLRKDKKTKALVEGMSQETIIDVLQQATAEPDVPAEAFRDLGNALLKSNQMDEAKTAFKSYLTIAPNAPDAQLVKSMIS